MDNMKLNPHLDFLWLGFFWFDLLSLAALFSGLFVFFESDLWSFGVLLFSSWIWPFFCIV